MHGRNQAADWMTHSAPEIRAIGETDGSVVIVPVGSLEQHGNHLPVGTDTLLVTAAIDHALDGLDGDLPVLATPPVWTGYSPHHLSFGGTASIGFDRLVHLLSDVAATTLENGFDAAFLVNGHGGNKPAMSAAVSEIGVDHPGREILGVTYFDLAVEEVDEIRDSDPGGMAHGGEFETSLMLHLYPELVDETAMTGVDLDEPYEHGMDDMFAGGPLSVYRDFEAYSPSGAIGDPSLASAEKGRRLLGVVAGELSGIIEEINEQTG